MKQTNFGATARKFVIGFVMMLGFMFVAGNISAQSLLDVKQDLTTINYKAPAVAQYDLDATLTQLKAYFQTNPSWTTQEETELILKANYWRAAQASLAKGENVSSADKAGIQQALEIVNQYSTIDPSRLSGVNVSGTIQSARAVVKN